MNSTDQSTISKDKNLTMMTKFFEFSRLRLSILNFIRFQNQDSTSASLKKAHPSFSFILCLSILLLPILFFHPLLSILSLTPFSFYVFVQCIVYHHLSSILGLPFCPFNLSSSIFCFSFVVFHPCILCLVSFLLHLLYSIFCLPFFVIHPLLYLSCYIFCFPSFAFFVRSLSSIFYLPSFIFYPLPSFVCLI